MKISVMEIGTNSIKFIIAEANGEKSLKVIDKCSTVNRLSRNMYNNNCICRESIDSAVDIIGEYMEMADKRKAPLVSIFSTSVLRDAANRDEFIERVRLSYGINIEVISGEEEALLSYKACSSLADARHKSFAVIDIGGGSTEISIGSKKSIERNISIDIGAVRLTETFIKNDPVDYEEIAGLSRHLIGVFQDAHLKDFKDMQLIGTGGTIKSVSTIHNKLDYKNEEKIHGSVISFDDIGFIFNFLAQLTVEKRKNLEGLNPKRADVIIAGTAILYGFMKKYGINEITVSSKGVIEAYVQQYISSKF
ncbi:Ppx/GppA phosphatase [Anaerobacterium chartisolvens]|uniref:Ppx/GppA phosphatase n=1 Tax=Anaerobacterium chartisolvens TaxID=1297424 RepID=A0A369AWB8_9FIRM|nr:Ppx/GppA phosphatase family protein [Anaerobacterium chartisolvens]RCX12546.1 Ppx/GppA phosphatase [Anaerobacterium chartisolvens]